jgi:transposase InsO family protein
MLSKNDFSSELAELMAEEEWAEIWELVASDDEILEDIRAATLRDKPLKPIIAYLKSGPAAAPALAQKAMSEYKWEDGLVYRKGKVYVPGDQRIKNKILKLYHDSPLAGHPGQAQTLDLVERGYYWPSMKHAVNVYIQECEDCQRNKNRHSQFHGKLQPLPTPEAPWKFISYDYVTGLPVSNGHDAILVVLDLFTKMGHFIAANSTDTAEDAARRFRREIWRLHGLPTDTASDRGTQFNAAFLRGLYEHLGIKPRFSTAYHPQTDGQTERANAVLESYLRMYTSRRQDDWADFLDMAEFAFNNRINTSTGTSPFRANYGFDPVFTTVPVVQQPSREGDDTAKRLKEIHDELVYTLERAKTRYAEFYDRHKDDTPQYQVGEKVWLEATNITIYRPGGTRSRPRNPEDPREKLDPRRLGPFEIVERIGERAYRLRLPATLAVHPVFHVSLLSRYRPRSETRGVGDGDGELEGADGTTKRISKILNSRQWRGRIQYLVAYQGLGRSHEEWIDAYYIPQDDFELLDAYHQQYPRAPRPSWVNRGTNRRRGPPPTIPRLRLPGRIAPPVDPREG